MALEPELYAWRRFTGVARFFGQAIDDYLQSESGLSLTEINLMIQVRESSSDLRLADLAERLHLTRAGTSKMIDRLEEVDLVCRLASKVDGRSKIVQLTRNGERTLKRIRPLFKSWIQAHFLDCLSKNERATLSRIMLTLSEWNQILDPVDWSSGSVYVEDDAKK